MILGQPAQDFRDETGATFGKAFTKATLVTATRVRLGVNYWMYAPKGFFAACDTVRDYTHQFVKVVLDKADAPKLPMEHGDSTTIQADRDNFIHDLNDEYHDISLVRDQVLNILLAGRDTTATTMTYVFRFLVRHPEVFKKLQKEIDAIVGDNSGITRAHIQQMAYLRNVMNETLRLRPPVPLNTRFCKRTTTIPRGGGEDGQSPILIRKGDSVAYSVYNMHRRTDIFGEDALSFRPERWENPDMTQIKWAFLPFNGGPRVCLGKDFGSMLVSYSIVRIIQAFPNIHLAPAESTEVLQGERQDVGLVLSTPDGCKVVLNSST